MDRDARHAEETTPDARPGRPTAPWVEPLLTVLGLLLFVVLAVIAAAIAVLLVPVRAGTVVVPVAVVVAAATNVALPWLTRQLVPTTMLAAAAPVVAWFITLVVLAGSRPEGDVLIPGGSDYQALTYVFYAMTIVGIGAGVATIVRSDRGRVRRVVMGSGPTVAGPTGSGATAPARPGRRSRRR